MRKVMVMVLALASMGTLSGCNSPDPGDRAVAGGLVGATAGALVGAAATGRASGALAGAAIGGAGGAIVSASSGQGRRCVRQGYDYYGNPTCVEYSFEQRL